MESRIVNDPRFSHVLTDPRFKTIPRRSRKVKIGSRFQSMFTDKRFKVQYGLDKRGRKVKQSSSDDLHKYYDLHDDIKNAMTSSQNGKLKKKKRSKFVASDDTNSPAVDEDIEKDHTHTNEVVSNSNSSSSETEDDEDSDTSTDIDDVIALPEPEVIHGWWDEEVSPSHSIETGSRLALCRMDWDRINATDIFVFLTSLKPQGGSIIQVTVFPSDFGLERIKNEDLQGPTELINQSDHSNDMTSTELINQSDHSNDMTSQEGPGYSNECLRKYQLQRLNYYYAVVECDSKATAEYVYEQCDGIQYEHCGGKLDLRFIPDDMTFDDREPQSVATETSIPVGYTPPDFVTSALQQSKVQMTWDETDPKRLQTTMRKLSRDDMLKMDFDAYLASSSGDDSGSECGTTGEGGEGPNTDHTSTKPSDKVTKYRSLLSGGDIGGDSVKCEDGEVMEISWEPGLREGVQDMVNKKHGEGEREGTTTWEQYLRDKKKKAKKKRNEVKGGLDSGNHGDEQVGNNMGFDDPFFKDGVSMATTDMPGKKKRSKSANGEQDKQEMSELELLMMEGGGGGEKGEGKKQHFSLESILQQEKQSTKKKKKKDEGGDIESVQDSFEVDVNDKRFTALYSNHHYALDPAHPHYRPTKATSAIMEERQKRRKVGVAKHPETTPTDQEQRSVFSDPSLSQLVKAVKSKTQSVSDRKKRLKAKWKQSKT